MAIHHGFVYILGNDSMPGIFKVGFTGNHPKTRMAQLSASTSCPTPFHLLAAFGVSQPQEAEKEIHLMLARFRVNHSREFFTAPVDYLLDIARQYGDPTEDFFQTSALEVLCDEQAIKSAREWKIDYFHSQCADPNHWRPRHWGFE